MAKMIKSRERVTDHGEVFTGEREVNTQYVFLEKGYE